MATATSKARAVGTGTAAAEWVKRVDRLERSGLTLRAFAEREGLKLGTLSFWKWKLAQARRSGARVSPIRFVELTAAPPAATSTWFEVVLPGSRTVRVPIGFDAAELARLVGVLEGARL